MVLFYSLDHRLFTHTEKQSWHRTNYPYWQSRYMSFFISLGRFQNSGHSGTLLDRWSLFESKNVMFK